MGISHTICTLMSFVVMLTVKLFKTLPTTTIPTQLYHKHLTNKLWWETITLHLLGHSIMHIFWCALRFQFAINSFLMCVSLIIKNCTLVIWHHYEVEMLSIRMAFEACHHVCEFKCFAQQKSLIICNGIFVQGDYRD